MQTMIDEPGKTQRQQFLLEERLSKLLGEQRHVLDYRQSHAPFAILCQLHNRRQQRSRQLRCTCTVGGV